MGMRFVILGFTNAAYQYSFSQTRTYRKPLVPLPHFCRTLRSNFDLDVSEHSRIMLHPCESAVRSLEVREGRTQAQLINNAYANSTAF
jgi:hypothetical protein